MRPHLLAHECYIMCTHDRYYTLLSRVESVHGNLPDVDMCPLHLSQGGSTILMLSSVMLKGYELLAYTTTGALGTGFRYS